MSSRNSIEDLSSHSSERISASPPPPSPPLTPTIIAEPDSPSSLQQHFYHENVADFHFPRIIENNNQKPFLSTFVDIDNSATVPTTTTTIASTNTTSPDTTESKGLFKKFAGKVIEWIRKSLANGKTEVGFPSLQQLNVLVFALPFCYFFMDIELVDPFLFLLHI